MTANDEKVTELENFFATATFPQQVKLYPGIKINDTLKFIESHLTVLKRYGNKGIWEVFYQRLLRLKEFAE